MGNAFAIRVHPDQPSATPPGLLSAWTDPIGEDLVDDVNEFFSELIEVVKDPVPFHERYFLKQLQVTEVATDDFDIRVVYDGAKVKKFIPFLPTEDDIVKTHLQIKADREKLHIVTTEINTETGEKAYDMHSVMHPDLENKTFTTEIWLVDKDGNRRSGALIAGMSEFLYVKPLLVCRFEQKVKVRSNVEVADSGGKSALSESLGEYYTAEEFFEALVTSIKQEALNMQVPGDITYKNDTEFCANWDIDIPIPDAFKNAETGQATFNIKASKSVVTDPKGLQICAEERLLGELCSTDFWRVHREPVRIEFWKVLSNGARVGGGREACAVRLKLMALINEAALGKEIKDLQDEAIFMF